MSGVSFEFTVVFPQMQVCQSGTASPTLTYSLENSLTPGSLSPLTFMSIDTTNGIISISNSSMSSNFNYKVIAKTIGISNNMLDSLEYTLYDLRLYFADLKNASMLSG